MKTAGEILKSARKRKRWTISELSVRTKIQPKYLAAIEESAFRRLPQAPFVSGFIRTAAAELGLEPEEMMAIFRRDFKMGRRGGIIPVNLISGRREKWSWSPKKTAAAAVGVVTVSFALYLLLQLRLLAAPPKLEVDFPRQEEIVSEDFPVEGRADTEAKVTINGQEIKKNQDGSFSQTIWLTEGIHTVTVTAVGRSGKPAVIQRTVRVKQK